MKTISKVLLLLIFFCYNSTFAVTKHEFTPEFRDEPNLKELLTHAVFSRTNPNVFNDAKEIFSDVYPEIKKMTSDGIYVYYAYDLKISETHFILYNQIYGYIPENVDSIYIYMIPGFPSVYHEFMDPEWTHCLMDHIHANMSGHQKYCTTVNSVPSELKPLVNEMAEKKYMSFHFESSLMEKTTENDIGSVTRMKKGSSYSISFNNLDRMHDNEISTNVLFEPYRKLFDLVKKMVRIEQKDCIWSNLIKNIEPFIKNTDFPTGFNDINTDRQICPKIYK